MVFSFFFQKVESWLADLQHEQISELNGDDYARLLFERNICGETGKIKSEKSMIWQKLSWRLLGVNQTTLRFLILHSSVLVPSCPTNFALLLLKLHPEQVLLSNEKELLHTAVTLNPSFDSNLYKCESCQHTIGDRRWFQHNSCCWRRICTISFHSIVRTDANHYSLSHAVDKINKISQDLSQFPNSARTLNNV